MIWDSYLIFVLFKVHFSFITFVYNFDFYKFYIFPFIGLNIFILMTLIIQF